MGMTTAPVNTREFKKVLERRRVELIQTLRKRNDIAIEKSPDQIDEIQHAATLELAIRNMDREYKLLRDVKAALLRIDDGSFGICVECEWAISPKRLVAVPWAPLCIECQEAADRDAQERPDFASETLVNAA